MLRPRSLLLGLCLVACTDDVGVEPREEQTGSSEGDSDTQTGTGDVGTEDGDTEGEASETDSTDSTDSTEEGETESDDGIPPDPDPRLEALETYAPRVYFPANEPYFPSSVDFAFPHLERFAVGGGDHWVRTQAALDSPSDTLPFFVGELETAPVYAFWADKGGGVVDLVYWIYYPYNRGKSVVDTIWGNHVGDWEHVTVRLQGDADEGYAPTQLYISAHSFGGAYAWGEGVELHEGTHPVVYSAWGSHGMWAAPGDHTYQTIGEEVLGVCVTLVCADLVDETSAGIAWDTWEVVEGFDFFAQEGLGEQAWPAWMSEDFADLGLGDPTVPGQGPIFRWGNPEDCSVLGVPIDITDLIGVCRLEDGPTGPVSKNTWGPELQ